jgi:hypothetical protein
MKSSDRLSEQAGALPAIFGADENAEARDAVNLNHPIGHLLHAAPLRDGPFEGIA